MKYDYTEKLYKLFIKGVYDGADLSSVFARERSFGVKKSEVEFALLSLLNSGRIEKKGNSYFLNEKAKKPISEKTFAAEHITGVLRTNERGFGFITVSGDKDYYVASSDLGDALNGDKVEAIAVAGRGTNDSARIIKVLERGKTSLVGVYFTEGALSYVRPDDKNYLCDIFIPDGHKSGAEIGDKVFVTITRFVKMRCPEGKIECVIGKPFLSSTEETAIILEHGLNKDFSESALDEARQIGQKVDDNALIGRLNLEKELIFTIDGDTAKDFDDAVSLEVLPSGNYLLGVHIADVSEYVKQGDAIDIAANERATSVYFPDRVIPMLPFELSDGICSLVEGEIRLTLSVFCEIDASGEVLSSDFKKSFIRSKKRLTYALVDRLFSGDEKVKKELGVIADKLFLMKDLSKLLKIKRRQKGYIDLDIKDSDITIDNGKINVALHTPTAATELIEQFMITANEAVAGHLFYQELPCIYRVHEPPMSEKLQALREFTAALGVKFSPKRDECYPKDIQKLLAGVSGKPCAAVVNKTVLRSLSKAKYSTLNSGHFGLASKCYCHFTSPIRRYPDLNVHRALKDLIDGKIYQKIDLYEDFFASAADISSQKERNAEDAERAVDDLYKAKYLEDRIGEDFKGIISGVTASSVFVCLENGCEVFCPMELLPAGKYEFDRTAISLTSGRFAFTIGKTVGVKIVGVDLGERKVHAAFTDLDNVRRKNRANGVAKKEKRW